MGFFEDEKKDSDLKKREHSLWVEKYRPDTIENYLGNDSFKEKLKSWLSNKDINNLLLCGNPGNGKTSAAKLIIKNLDCDYLFINASDENGIDTIREKVKTFASCVGFKAIKIVVLDEGDFLSTNAQSSLRNILEVFSRNTRFIVTCNYPERIIPALISRLQVYSLQPPTKKELAIHLSKILKNENIQYDLKDVAFIIDSYFPDIRKTINFCQQSVKDGKIHIEKSELIEGDVKLKIVDILKNRTKESFTQIRQLIADNKVKQFTEIYSFLYEKVDEYASGKVGNTILILAEGQYQESMVVDKEINFVSCIVQILNNLNSK